MKEIFTEKFIEDAIEKFKSFMHVKELPKQEREAEPLSAETVLFQKRANLIPADIFDESGYFKSEVAESELPDASIDGRSWFRRLMRKRDAEVAIDKILELHKVNLGKEHLTHTDIRNLVSYIELKFLLKEGYVTQTEYDAYFGA